MSSGSDGFDDLFSEENAQIPRKRRGLTAIILAVVVVLLAVLAVWGDGVARGAAEDVVESELADRLPAGAGPIDARIGGFAFLPQFFSGTLDELDVTFALDGESISSLAGAGNEAGNLTVANGGITHDGAVSVLGVEVGFTVTLELRLEGGAVILTPTTVEAATDAVSVDLGQLVDLESLTMRACAARLLPESLELTSVEVVGSQLQFEVSGQDVPVNLSELRQRGSCE